LSVLLAVVCLPQTSNTNNNSGGSGRQPETAGSGPDDGIDCRLGAAIHPCNDQSKAFCGRSSLVAGLVWCTETGPVTEQIRPLSSRLIRPLSVLLAVAEPY
jgi:hypothetical protein